MVHLVQTCLWLVITVLLLIWQSLCCFVIINEMIDALKKAAVFLTCTKPQCLNFFSVALSVCSGSVFCCTSHVTLTSVVSDQSLE